MVDIVNALGGYQLRAAGLGLIPAECIDVKDIIDSETVVDTIKNLRENLKVRTSGRRDRHLGPFRDRQEGGDLAHERIRS
jgi:hypothetical protein